MENNTNISQQENQQIDNDPVSDTQKNQDPTPSQDIDKKISGLREQGKKQGKKKRIYSFIGITIILIFAAIIVAMAYYYWPEINNINGKAEKKIPCTLEAKICPGGSSVGRIPPDCQFAECPAVKKKDYYQVLEDKCDGDGCCLASVKVMKENSYKESGSSGCFKNFISNLLKCEASLKWCEPVGKKGINTSDYKTYIDEKFGSQDTDNDGLFDGQELEYGTDPENPDSDGDGFLDGEEVKNGHNPLGDGKLDK